MRPKSEEEIQREVDQRLREIEQLQQQAHDRGLEFVALSEEGLRAKLAGESAQSPYFYGAGYNSAASPGGTFMYEVAIANPDPTDCLLLITVFFGMANFINDISFGPAHRNPEWPYLSCRPFVLAAGSTTTQAFTLQAPTSVLLGTYTGNVVLWRPQFFDQGVYFDRGYFDLTLQ
jgi:hypothetical protein